MRIKQGLKKTDEIATYLASKLKSLGFEIVERYPTLKTWDIP